MKINISHTIIYTLLLLLASTALRAQVDAYPYECGFENGLDGWTNASGQTNNWVIGRGDAAYKTNGKNFETGPKEAYNGNSYAYVNLFDNNSASPITMVKTFDFSTLTNPILSMYVHNYWTDGNGAQLQVYVKETQDHDQSWNYKNLIMDSEGDEWHKVNLCLSDYAGLPSIEIKIVIDPDRGSKQPNIAIDDLQIVDFTLTADVTDVTCYDYDDGVIKLTPHYAGPEYEYSLHDGVDYTKSTEKSMTYTGLRHGTYNAKIRDVTSQCVATMPAIPVVEPAEIQVSYGMVDIDCYGDTDGELIVMASEGSEDHSPYEFSIDGGNSFQSNSRFEGLSGGKYTLQVKNSRKCLSKTQEAQLGEDVILEIRDIQPTHITRCYGDMSGRLVITASFGKNTPIGFSIDGGQTFSNMKEEFTNLAAGEYDITIQDSKGCRISWPEPVEIKQPDKLEIDKLLHTDINGCYGDQNGTITIEAKGGTEPYFYTADGLIYDAKSYYTDLKAGIYHVAAYDNQGCTVDGGEVTIREPEPLQIQYVRPVNINTCHGDATGSIEIAATGGTGTITYYISGSEIPPSETPVFKNLKAGTYTPFVIDEKGCMATYGNQSVTLSEPELFKIISITDIDETILCNGDKTGSIYVVANGGTLPYYYSVDDFYTSKTMQTVETCPFTNLGAGEYHVRAKDAMGCEAQDSLIVLEEPEKLEVTNIVITDNKCYRDYAGTISMEAVGGTPTYTYGYSIHGDDNFRFSSLPLIQKLPGDIYDLAVKDRNECVAYSYSHVVNEPTELVITAIVPFDVSICYGSTNGSLIVNASGGTKPYQFSIDNGESFHDGELFDNLPAGNNYHVVVRDKNECEIDGGTTLINQPAPVVIEYINFQDVHGCSGDATGWITFTASGGTGQLKYSITGHPEQLDGNFMNIPGGEYSLRVEDTHGCADEHPGLTISDPEALEFVGEPELTHNLCFGDNDGIAIITTRGGKPIQAEFPYKYFLNQPDDVEGDPYCYDGIFEHLYAGDYSYIVRDAYGCQIKGKFTITEPDLFEITSLDTLNVNTCNGDSTGRIKTIVTGGVKPVQYTLQSNKKHIQNETGIFDKLTATQYAIVATDGNGCMSDQYINLEEPSRINFDARLTQDILCHDEGAGEIMVDADGGTGSFKVTLDGGKTFPYEPGYIQNLKSGKYIVTVKDANGCVAKYSREITIKNPTQLEVTAEATDVACFDGNTGKITAQASGGSRPYSFSIDQVQWKDNNSVFNDLTDGTYTVYVRDIYGCTVHTQPLTIKRPSNKASFKLSTYEGCSPLELTITQDNPGLTSYTISNGDRIYDRNAPTTYTFVNTNTVVQKYEIRADLSFDNGVGCTDTAYQYVTVYPQPKVDFRLADTMITWPNNTAYVANLSKNVTSAYWDFGDGTTSNTIDETAHTYPSCGYYNIRLIESDGRCYDTLEQTFSIEGREIIAAFNTDKNSGCEPATFTFSNASSNIDSLVWDFGDGTKVVSGSQNVRHTYAGSGDYTATLTLYGDCGSSTTTSKTVTVFPKPTAAFQQNLDTIYEGQILRVYCESALTDHYIWDFGDGTKEQGLATMEHEYKFDGTFDISLVVVTGNSCSDTSKVKNAVTVVTTPIVVFPNAFTPNDDGLNDIFMPVHGIVSTYEIMIFDRKGLMVFNSKNIEEGWDGTYKGQKCLPGMYVYKVKTTLRDETIHYQYGHVMMYR